MSNASVTTIFLLALTLVGISLAWVITSGLAGIEHEIDEIDRMDCGELFEYILTEDTTATPREHAHQKYLLECRA